MTTPRIGDTMTSGTLGQSRSGTKVHTVDASGWSEGSWGGWWHGVARCGADIKRNHPSQGDADFTDGVYSSIPRCTSCARAEECSTHAQRRMIMAHGMTVTDTAQTLMSYGYGCDDWQGTGPGDDEGWIAGEGHRILVERDCFRFTRSGHFWSMAPTFEALLIALRRGAQ